MSDRVVTTFDKGRIPQMRQQYREQEINPDNVSGNEAWKAAQEKYEDLDEKNQSEFVRAWYEAVNYSQKGLAKTSKSIRKTGVGKDGKPTNGARTTKLEEDMSDLWSSLGKYGKGKSKKIQKIIEEASKRADEKTQEIRARHQREREEKARKKAEATA